MHRASGSGRRAVTVTRNRNLVAASIHCADESVGPQQVHRALEVASQRRLEEHRIVGDGMAEAEHGCMQTLSRQQRSIRGASNITLAQVRSAVHVVARQGMPNV